MSITIYLFSIKNRHSKKLSGYTLKYPWIHPRFYSPFWRNKPRHALSLQTGSVGAPKGCFYLFPLCSEGVDEKNVKSSIFRKKTSKFLSSLPFKMQTIDNQWPYDAASTCNKAPNYNNIILILATLSGSVTADNGGIFSASYMVVMVGTIISDFDDMRYNKLVRMPNGSSRDDSGIASI